ncbi:MAG: peptidoglycan DD-metalloendopeptidase family protein [Gammaproteobacteria bacterium]|nr:peptidoglycan DD-metalloendopeptidase family protein [Gammaproteobacteria bacterium]
MKKRLTPIIFISFLLAACSNEENIRDKVINWDPYQYTVHQGDTLYSIAWRYDLDFKLIIKWNNIVKPYTIYPGQRLKMAAPVVEPEGKTYLFGGNEKRHTEEVEVPDYSIAGNVPKAPAINKWDRNKNANIIRSKKFSSPKYHYKKPATAVKKTPIPAADTDQSSARKLSWSWPFKGKVITTFAANNNNRKGIDIKGESDQNITASESGKVVYSGSGLLSYGNLIIIKHSDLFLSAYAYNKKLLVKEGAVVKKGQIIAIVGKNLNVTNLLHFEIRKNGKPVNPLLYLPSRI